MTKKKVSVTATPTLNQEFSFDQNVLKCWISERSFRHPFVFHDVFSSSHDLKGVICHRVLFLESMRVLRIRSNPTATWEDEMKKHWGEVLRRICYVRIELYTQTLHCIWYLSYFERKQIPFRTSFKSSSHVPSILICCPNIEFSGPLFSLSRDVETKKTTPKVPFCTLKSTQNEWWRMPSHHFSVLCVHCRELFNSICHSSSVMDAWIENEMPAKTRGWHME